MGLNKIDFSLEVNNLPLGILTDTTQELQVFGRLFGWAVNYKNIKNINIELMLNLHLSSLFLNIQVSFQNLKVDISLKIN